MAKQHHEIVMFKVLIINYEPNLEDNSGRVILPSTQSFKEKLIRDFRNTEQGFIFEAVTIGDIANPALEKLAEFKSDFVILDYSNFSIDIFNAFVDMLWASFDRPKEIIIINIDHFTLKEIILYENNAYFAYIEKGKDMYPLLINVLGNLWIKRHEYV